MKALQFLVTIRQKALDQTRDKTTATLSDLITKALDEPDTIRLSKNFIHISTVTHPLDSHWDEDPQFPVKDWQTEVENDDTRLGYRDWVINQKDLCE